MRYILYALLFPFYVVKVFVMTVTGIVIFPFYAIYMCFSSNMDEMESDTNQWIKWTFTYVIH